MPRVVDISGTQVILQKALFSHQFFLRILRLPLERCKRLRDKERSTDRDVRTAHLLAGLTSDIEVELLNTFCKIGDTQYILSCLRRKTEHEVKLYRAPSAHESEAQRGEDIFFSDVFVDDITKSLGTCFRRECQTGFSR